MALSVTIDPTDSSRLVFSEPVTLQQAIAFLWSKPPDPKDALRPDPQERPAGAAQRKFIIKKDDLSLIFSLRHGLANEYAKRIRPIMAKSPATLPSWVPRDVREKVLNFKLGSGVHRFPGEKPWGGVIVWIRHGDYMHVQLYQEYPESLDYYLEIAHGNDHNARLLRRVYRQFNSDMRYFVEQKGMSPEEARNEIRRINEEVFKLIIEGVAMVMSSGAALSAMNNTIRATAPKIIDAAKGTRLAKSGASLSGIRVTITKNEGAAIGRLQTALRNKQPWTTLSRTDRAMLGTLFHKVVEPLSEFVFRGVGRVFKRSRITTDSIRQMRQGGGRILIVEGEMVVKGKTLRVDLAELDFRSNKLTVVDLTSVERAEHVAKTGAYRTALKELTGFDAAAMEMRYIGDDSSLLETLAEVLLDST